VIRSVAARPPGSDTGVLTELPFDSSTARIAVNASVASDTPQCAASSAKRRFSSGVGRAVIDGVRDVVVLLLTRAPLVQQNADTSLSCHHNNTNSESEDFYTLDSADVDESDGDRQEADELTHLVRDAEGAELGILATRAVLKGR
jgi:hypothetical protein